MYQKLLVATDLTPASAPATRTAVALAQKLGARVALIYVINALDEQGNWFLPDSPAMQAFREALAREEEAVGVRLAEALREAGADPASAETVVAHGSPADEIVAAATRIGADLIVMGTHGRRGIQHAVMGSVAERVVRTAPTAVLVVRTPRA